MLQDMGRFILILLLFAAKWKRLLHELPAHWALLEILDAAIAQARVSAGQEDPVHGAILANNTVFGVFFLQFRFISSQPGLFQQPCVSAALTREGITGGGCRTICRHEELLQIMVLTLS